MVKVSVLLPTFKRAGHLKECVESILANGYQLLEVLVLDQSPDDETRSALEMVVDPRLTYLHLDVAGKSRALNAGLAKCSGDVVCLVDDDCLVGPDWVEVVAGEFEADERLDVLSGPVLPKLLDPQAVPVAVTVRMERRVYERRRNPFGGSVGANVAYRRDVMDKAGFFDEALGPGARFQAVEDNEYFYRALRHVRRGAYTPNMVMHHKQWRVEGEAWERIDDYRRGSAAFIGKYLLHFDPWPAIYYFQYLSRHLYSGVRYWRKWEFSFLRSELRILLPWAWKAMKFYRRPKMGAEVV